MALSHWNLSGANFSPMNACTQTRSAAPLIRIQIFRLRQCEGNTGKPNENVSILQQTNAINLSFNDVPVCEERPTFMEFTPNKSLAVIKKNCVRGFKSHMISFPRYLSCHPQCQCNKKCND